ncbi:HAMP domain-containing histidine kinase [Paenibacillus sp. N3/727]|uniref:HAMP domain-containing sensor histidine kinase n=1 Tax=Paenibacillus sp. N3/727 TaxID=2925845 RepID=UPI001F533BE7|nr:HAMP domain-containing sensor histidine kinase [Paenibacillus sp. N3/727]UNK20997.1 HAMP domain-containing histidine kinase [Paenibacillus sp. N3/727]
MNKLGRKLFISISVAVLFIFVMFVLLANLFMPKYYIYKTKEQLREAVNTISGLSEAKWTDGIPLLEQQYRVTIVYDDLLKGENDLNESLKQQLATKRVTLNKFWITDESLQKVKAGARVNKIYDQGKLKSSFYASFIPKGETIVLIGLSMAYISDTVRMINEFILILALCSMLIIVSVVWILSYRMTKPLKELGQVAKDISELRFRKARVDTRDEIEELAESINVMSDKLSAAHADLSRKNVSLKRFMSDMTHELKTPVSLIQAYAEGIQDGLDDGSYAATILRQNENMARLIDEFLNFAKIERDELELKYVAVKDLFQECAKKFGIELESRHLQLVIRDELPGNPVIEADRDKIQMVFHNLLGNAVKYAAGERIDVVFAKQDAEIVLHMSNRLSREIVDASRLWEPFFVVESSRHKEESGTGLGLAIVKTVLERQGFRCHAETKDQTIHFYIYFKEKSPRSA